MIASIVKGGILQQLCALYPDLIDINQQNSEGTTALMIAIENDEANVKILLDAGADPEIANNNGTTPLNAAEVMGNENVINLIKEAIDKKHGRQ
jgi:ankyrin repeat protein